MVAQTIKLPNVRKFFIPDTDYIIGEADLSGADAQVVGWEADEPAMKAAFRKGMKIHVFNTRQMYPEIVKDWTDEEIKATDYAGGIYHKVKQTGHATNYGGSAKTIAGITKQTIRDVQEFQERYFSTYPGIEKWHDRTELAVQTTRIITNKFGYRIMYFDRPEQSFTKALAWIPQSTVACVRTRGALALAEQCPFIEHLMEVHDSIVFQLHKSYENLIPDIEKALQITVPYDDPLVIPWGIKYSTKSWGDIE